MTQEYAPEPDLRDTVERLAKGQSELGRGEVAVRAQVRAVSRQESHLPYDGDGPVDVEAVLRELVEVLGALGIALPGARVVRSGEYGPDGRPGPYIALGEISAAEAREWAAALRRALER
ncbi:hypothetical protein RKE29_20935 [Streptomyces sp. B1866]|uniref:hypothetical protein n=1 Tax=Streptomyces sp. B1866 TaxID=3075431 RepID=UPI0028918051|nr:hypothetical protein [Streptomyces sp. B1866]MDT3399080.1 hypothetical protein [Streptomyces sp. B1866]